MNRRHFLQSLLAVPALTLALAKKPEAALCKCGKPMPGCVGPSYPDPDELSARYIRPAVQALLDAEDARIALAYANVNEQMDAWYGEPVGGWHAKPVSSLLVDHGQVFIASGGQGYILNVRPSQRYAVSKLSNPEVW